MLPERLTPDLLRQLESFSIRSRRLSLGLRQGGHMSQRRGHGMEFSDYRRYEPGDNPRHIDWGVYGRTDKIYIKVYREERSLSVLLILDTSASMMMENKWESARDIALSLAYISLKQQDRVSICALGNGLSPGYTGARSFGQIARYIDQLELGKPSSSDPEAVEREIRRCVSGLKFPGVAVYLSDFLVAPQSYERVVGHLRSKDLDITAIQILAPVDVDPLGNEVDAVVVDSETGEELPISWDDNARRAYGAQLVAHNERLKLFMTSGRNRYCLALSEQSLLAIMTQALPRTGLIG